jgi:hypothetical protein
MACGIPIAGFDAGGAGDLISHGQSGLLAPVGDAKALSAALVSMILDPARTRVMGQAARQLVENKFTLRQQAQFHLALYEDLIKQSTSNQDARSLKLPVRMEKIVPHLVTIAESITRFIQLERASSSDQLQALARQNAVENQKLEVKLAHCEQALKRAQRTPFNRLKSIIKKGLQHFRVG